VTLWGVNKQEETVWGPAGPLTEKKIAGGGARVMEGTRGFSTLSLRREITRVSDGKATKIVPLPPKPRKEERRYLLQGIFLEWFGESLRKRQGRHFQGARGSMRGDSERKPRAREKGGRHAKYERVEKSLSIILSTMLERNRRRREAGRQNPHEGAGRRRETNNSQRISPPRERALREILENRRDDEARLEDFGEGSGLGAAEPGTGQSFKLTLTQRLKTQG